MTMRLLTRLIWHLGKRRLKHGYCPACYSSPPRPECTICLGNNAYGSLLDPKEAKYWHLRWNVYCEEIR